jgi:hypothetical protein
MSGTAVCCGGACRDGGDGERRFTLAAALQALVRGLLG